MKYLRFIEAAGGWDRFQSVLGCVETVARRRGVSIANIAGRLILDEPAVAGIISARDSGRPSTSRTTCGCSESS